MSRRITIIGQAPSATSGARPFDGPSGERLAELAGLTLEELRERARLVNLLGRYPGRSPNKTKGDRFPIAEARDRAARIRITTPIVVLCGTRVAEAFGVWSAPFGVRGCFEWTLLRERHSAIVVPHPSAVNRWWNDASNANFARGFFLQLFHDP